MLHLQSKAAAAATLAFASSVTAGNLLIVAFRDLGTVDPLTVTDTVGTAYTKMALVSGTGKDLAVYAGIAAGGGANTVSVAGSGGSAPHLVISEFSGAGLPADAVAEADNRTNPSTAAITTTLAGDLLYEAQGGTSSGYPYPTDEFVRVAPPALSVESILAAYRVAGAAGAYTASNLVPGAGVAPLAVVAFPAIAPALCLPILAPPTAVAGAAYSHVLSAIGGTGPFTFALTSGALPTGLTLAANGTISGTSSVVGTVSVTVSVTDSLSAVASRVYSFAVSAATGDLSRLGWTVYATTDDGVDGADGLIDGGSDFWESANDGTTPLEVWVDMGRAQQFNYVTFQIFSRFAGKVEAYVSNDGVDWGSAPVGWSIWASVSTGTVVFPAQTWRWVKLVLVQGAIRNGTEFRVGYDPAKVGTFSAWADAELPDATVGDPYRYAVHIGQGVAPYTVAVLSGALPAGLSIDDAGLLWGTPTAGGAFSFVLRISDSGGSHIDISAYLFVFQSGEIGLGSMLVRVRLFVKASFTTDDASHTSGVIYVAPDAMDGGDGLSPTEFPGTAWALLDPAVHGLGISASAAPQTILCADSLFGVSDSGTPWISTFPPYGDPSYAKLAVFVGLTGDYPGAPSEVRCYGVYLQADYSDGKRAYSYPVNAVQTLEFPSTDGHVDNPAFANDGSFTTYAAIIRSATALIAPAPTQVRLDGFGSFASLPLNPPATFRNFAY